MLKCRVLVGAEGPIEGALLPLTAPLSLWGGLDATTGRIADPRHPEFQRSVVGTVLVVPEPVGSSSSSAIMLELMREGTAPSAVILGCADAILVLGVVVGRELGYPPVPVLQAVPDELARLMPHVDVSVSVTESGVVTRSPSDPCPALRAPAPPETPSADTAPEPSTARPHP